MPKEWENIRKRTDYLRPVLWAFLISPQAIAQQSAIKNAGELQIALQKLNILGSVLYIGAHPDDENTAVLAYLSKEKKYRTAYLSLTRGDGGQNLIGSEKGSRNRHCPHPGTSGSAQYRRRRTVSSPGLSISDIRKHPKKRSISGIRQKFFPIWSG